MSKKISPTTAVSYSQLKSHDDKFFDSSLYADEIYKTKISDKVGVQQKQLVDAQNKENSNDLFEEKKTDEEEIGKIPILIHQIEIGDTLDGLMLQYGVSKGAIKKYNQLEGDDIYYLKQIKIPNPTTDYNAPDLTAEEIENLRKEQLHESFRMQVPKEDRKLSKMYMEEANYVVDEALRLYKEDLEWEKTTGKLPKSHQLQQPQRPRQNIQLHEMSMSKKID